MESSKLLTAYKVAFDLGPPCVLLKPDSPSFTIVDVNQKYLELTQSNKESLLGKSFLEIIRGTDNKTKETQVVEDAFNAVLETKELAIHQAAWLHLRTAESNKYKKKYWTAMTTPVLDESGELSAIIYSPTDVTDSFETPELAESIEKASDREKEFYKSVFWQAPVAIGVWESPDFITIEINPALAALYQRENAEIAGKKIFDVFPDAKEKWWQILTDVISTGRPYKGTEIEVDLSSDGSDRRAFVNSIIVPHYTRDGRIAGLIGVNTDVTEEVTLRRNLEDNEKIMKLATESAKLGVWDVDLRNHTIHSSSHFWIAGFPIKKSSYHLEEFIEQIVTEDQQIVSDLLKNSTANFNVQVRVNWLDGSVHWLQLTGDTLKDEKDEPIRIVGTTLDITEAKDLEKRKDDLISTVSHELKTPVTSINAIAQILEKKFSQSQDKMVLGLLNKLVNQIKRLIHLIHDLLDASLMEGGKLQLKKTDFMFNELVEEVTTELERTYTSHKIIIQSNPPAPSFSDKERLRQVLTNLVNNAIKYSPNQDQVMVSIEVKEKQIHFCVKDAGIGIPKDKAPHIFERFYRIVDENHFGFQGIGIGLYISKQIIERLDGNIWFESEEGKGSTFCFSVPAISAATS